MNNTINLGAFFAALLLSLFVYAIYGALFAWGLQPHLESILDRNISYWNLFWAAFLTLVFLTKNPVTVE